MNINELINSDIRSNLVSEINGMNFNRYTENDLSFLKEWCNRVRQFADTRTLENEFVGYTYLNLDAINSNLVKKKTL